MRYAASGSFRKLQEELQKQVNQLTRELKEARDAMLSGNGRAAEMQRLMEEELEREKEKRVAHLGEMGVKRLMNQGLARGWSAWHEVWAEKVRKRNLLKQAGARLTKPKLVKSYAHWRRDWEVEMQLNGLMTQEQKL